MGVFARVKEWMGEAAERQATSRDAAQRRSQNDEGWGALATRNVTTPEPAWTEGCHAQPTTVTGPGGWEIGCTILTPNTVAGDQVLVFVHGGVFITGMYEAHWRVLSSVALRAQRRCVMVDYRHPTDCTMVNAAAAISTVLEALRAGALMSPPAPTTVLVGEGPGANLAAATCFLELNEGRPGPAGLALFAPMLAQSQGTMAGGMIARMIPGLDERGEIWARGLPPGHPYLDLFVGPVSRLPRTLLVNGRKHPGFASCERLVQATGSGAPQDRPLVTFVETKDFFHADSISAGQWAAVDDTVSALVEWLGPAR